MQTIDFLFVMAFKSSKLRVFCADFQQITILLNIIRIIFQKHSGLLKSSVKNEKPPLFSTNGSGKAYKLILFSLFVVCVAKITSPDYFHKQAGLFLFGLSPLSYIEHDKNITNLAIIKIYLRSLCFIVGS